MAVHRKEEYSWLGFVNVINVKNAGRLGPTTGLAPATTDAGDAIRRQRPTTTTISASLSVKATTSPDGS
jgi:hypothetical protein